MHFISVERPQCFSYHDTQDTPLFKYIITYLPGLNKTVQFNKRYTKDRVHKFIIRPKKKKKRTQSRLNRNKLHHKGEKFYHYKGIVCLGKYMYVLWYSKMYLFKIPLNRICLGQQRCFKILYSFKNTFLYWIFVVLKSTGYVH